MSADDQVTLSEDGLPFDEEIETIDLETETVDMEVDDDNIMTMDIDVIDNRDDIAECFSVPRIVPAVRAAGGQGRLSLDTASSGHDFLRAPDRATALLWLDTFNVQVLGLTHPCTMFSKLMKLWNENKLSPDKLRWNKQEAALLFKLAI